MKVRQVLIITVGLLVLQGSLHAQSFKLKNYKMTIKGTSTLHDWESATEKLEAKGYCTLQNTVLADVRGVEVKIPVTSIKSPKGKMMDSKTYKAFNHEKYPNIIFTLNTKKITETNSTMDLKGSLTMAGVTKTIDLTVNYKLLPNGELQVIGSKEIIMTDFGMEPPTAMMGTIKSGDAVVVTFDMTFTINNAIL